MKRTGLLLSILLLGYSAMAQGQKRADIVFEDFEGKDYGRWTTTGTAFGSGPAHGPLPGQMAVSGFHGRGLVPTLSRLAMSAVKTGMCAVLAATIAVPTERESQGQSTMALTFLVIKSLT